MSRSPRASRSACSARSRERHAVEGVVIAAFLAFCRIGGCFLLMPGLSSARVPIQVRLFVAIAATGGAARPSVGPDLPLRRSRNPAVLLPLIVSELLIGALIGLMARLYMLALQFIGVGHRHADRLWRHRRRRHRGAATRRQRSARIISFSALLLLFVFDFHHEIIKALVAVLRRRAGQRLVQPAGGAGRRHRHDVGIASWW